MASKRGDNPRKRRVRTSAIWISLLIYILAGVVGSEAMVLCFGSNGHIAIEAPPGGLCSETLDVSNETASPSTISSPSPSQDHCGPCVDFPIFTEPYLASVQYASAQNLSGLHAISESPAVIFPDVATINLLPVPPPSADKTLNYLRTVILLI